MKFPFSLSLNKSALTKILGLFVLLAISAGIGYLIYTLFFKQKVVTPITEVPQNTGQLPVAGTGTPGTGVTPVTPGLPGAVTIPVTKIPGAPTVSLPSTIAQGGITKVQTLSYESNMAATLYKDKNNLVSYDKNSGKFYLTSASGQRIALSDKTFPKFPGQIPPQKRF